MKLSDASPSYPHQENIRYTARIELPLVANAVYRIQRCVQEFTKNHSRVLVIPTRCLGVRHSRGTLASLLSDAPPINGFSLSSQQEVKVSAIVVQPEDVITFSLLPGGSQAMRAFYRGMVKSWADDLIVEEVEWSSWIAIAAATRSAVTIAN